MVLLTTYRTPKITYCILKMQPDVLLHYSINSFPVFGLRDCVHGYPSGTLLLPLIDGALSTIERGHGALVGGGFLFPPFIQENRQLIQHFLFCYKLSNFKAAHSSCKQVWSSICGGSVFAQDERKNCAYYSAPQYSQLVHAHLPGSVFLLPSAPMMTSNSSSLTGCVLGWTSALQPISVRYSAYVIRQKCTRRASRGLNSHF